MRQLLFILLFFLAACGDLVRFEAPQPEGRKNEDSFSKKMFGTYISTEDSSLLFISKDGVISSFKSEYKGLFSELDSVDRVGIKGDTTYTEADGPMRASFRLKGDSIFQYLDYRDTVFSFTRRDILRKFKGYYFLNQELAPGQWRVTKLGGTKAGLSLGAITGKEDLENLRELTNSASDTLFHFKPTKKEFRRFIKKEKGFQSEERFIKIK